MIFQRRDDQMGNNMMDWGSYMWFYMILGMVICILIIIIIIYWLTRRTHKDKDLEKPNQKSIQIGEAKDVKGEKPYFCPNCKEKLDDKTLKYCPFCGSEL